MSIIFVFTNNDVYRKYTLLFPTKNVRSISLYLLFKKYGFYWQLKHDSYILILSALRWDSFLLAFTATEFFIYWIFLSLSLYRIAIVSRFIIPLLTSSKVQHFLPTAHLKISSSSDFCTRNDDLVYHFDLMIFMSFLYIPCRNFDCFFWELVGVTRNRP